ncbi:MAG: pantetheine-phosphate adenylyltransferase [Deltaproteobacteria bacterium]|jgi:pantetheine-phosphate adenylyltransferase|nr:pantetheine-phosphate adenylyltransferase [Deltaproteobacteria bacterium]
MSELAIYPGTFDPPTLGHLGLIRRILDLFDHLVIVVANNPKKMTLFSIEERLEMLRESLIGENFGEKVAIDSFDGLIVDYAKLKGAKAIVRGLRGSSDFDYEFQLNMINRHLNQQIQSVFLMADYQWFFIRSSTVKEAAALGADISDLVTPFVARKLAARFS